MFLYDIFGWGWWYDYLVTVLNSFLYFGNVIVFFFRILHLLRVLSEIVILMLFFGFFMLVGEVGVDVEGFVGVKVDVGASGSVEKLVFVMCYIL